MRRALGTILCLAATGCGGGCSSSATPAAVPVPDRVGETIQQVQAAALSGLAELSSRLMEVERKLEAFIPTITGRIDDLEGRVEALEKRMKQRERAEWVLPEGVTVKEEL